MANQYDANKIRLQCTIKSAPGVPPFDVWTGEAPQWWRATDLNIDFAVFDVNSVCVDLSNMASLTLLVLAAPDQQDPIIESDIEPSNLITPVIAIGDWLAGTAQQGTFVLGAGENDLDLGGAENAQFWMVVRGTSKDGKTINYGGVWVTVWETGIGPAAITDNAGNAITDNAGNAITP